MHPILMADVAQLRSEELLARAERRRLLRSARLGMWSRRPVVAAGVRTPPRWAADTMPTEMRT